MNCPKCGEDVKKFAFRIGDLVLVRDKEDNKLLRMGVVKCHSIGWHPPLYRVVFSFQNYSAEWYPEESLELYPRPPVTFIYNGKIIYSGSDWRVVPDMW